MVTIDLGKPADNAAEFAILRSSALEQYASVEQSLCMLLATLLKTELPLAATIFFQITNTKSRNRITQDLMSKRYADKYTHFWHGIPNTPHKRGLMTLIQELDTQRNQLVHWHTANEIGVDDSGVTKSTLTLRPPNFWSGSSSVMATGDLAAFSAKADFVSRAINMFCLVNSEHGQHIADSTTWHDIFQQPCIYPPPDSHPLSPNYKAPQTPPQS